MRKTSSTAPLSVVYAAEFIRDAKPAHIVHVGSTTTMLAPFLQRVPRCAHASPIATALNFRQRQCGHGTTNTSLIVAEVGATCTGIFIDEDAHAINPTLRCSGRFVVDIEVKETHLYNFEGAVDAQVWQSNPARIDKRGSTLQSLSGARRASHRAAALVWTRVAPPPEVLP